MLLLAGSHHNLYLKNIRIVEIILELLLAPDCPPPLPPPLIISRLVWLIEQLGDHGRGQRGACDLNIRRVGLLTLHPPTLGWVLSLVLVLHYRQSAHHWHVNMTPFTYNHTLTLYFEYLEFKDLFLENDPKIWLLVQVNPYNSTGSKQVRSMKCPAQSSSARLIHFLLNVDTL